MAVGGGGEAGGGGEKAGEKTWLVRWGKGRFLKTVEAPVIELKTLSNLELRNPLPSDSFGKIKVCVWFRKRELQRQNSSAQFIYYAEKLLVIFIREKKYFSYRIQRLFL